MRALGIQLKTKYFSGKEDALFIDKEHLKAIVIQEGITCGTLLVNNCAVTVNFTVRGRAGSVIFYLAIIVHGRDKLLVAFNVNFSDFPCFITIYISCSIYYPGTSICSKF